MIDHESCQHSAPVAHSWHNFENEPEIATTVTFTAISPQEIKSLFSLRSSPVVHVLQFFADNHLPEELLAITVPIRTTAFNLTRNMMDGPELTVALRKMLDSRDAFVRHVLAVHNFKLSPYDN